MPKCRDCEYDVPEFVRLKGGAQRAGYRLLAQHARHAHGRPTRYRRGYGAGSVDDRCPICEGRGCGHCEPAGPVYYDGNTGLPLQDASM